MLGAVARLADDVGAVADGWNGFAVLHTAASRVGGLDIGFVPGEGGLGASAWPEPGALDVVFNLGADEIDDRRRAPSSSTRARTAIAARIGPT